MLHAGEVKREKGFTLFTCFVGSCWAPCDIIAKEAVFCWLLCLYFRKVILGILTVLRSFSNCQQSALRDIIARRAGLA